MKLRCIWGCVLACMLAPLALQAQIYTISKVSPTTLAAGVNGATIAISGTLPQTSTYGYCFYTGYGGTIPITPTSTGSNQTVVVPAARIQQIPPSAFTGGMFTAKLYVQITDSQCNGTYNTNVTNEQNITIALPTVNSVYATNLQQLNSTLGTQPPPYTLTFAGTEYLSNSNVTFTWSSGSAIGTPHLASANSLVTTVPSTIPATISTVTATLCNQAPLYSFCAPAQSINIAQLNGSQGSLAANPNPAIAQSSVTLSATFSPSAAQFVPPGGPTGAVTFTNGTTTIGTGKLILNTPSSFSAQTPTNLSASPVGALRMADLNADGIPDAIFFDDEVGLHVALGNTPFGAFQPESVSIPDANCAYINSFAIGDVNVDGYPDVVLNCTSTGGPVILDVLLGNGDGTFAAPVTLGNVYGTQIALADVNHDGYPDLVVAGVLNNVCPQVCPFGFAVFLGNGTSTFTPAFTETTSSNPGSQLLVVDLNNDHYPDILELNNLSMSTNSIDIYQNNAGTSFGTLSSGIYKPTTSVPLLAYPNFYLNLITADFNGDGLPDVGVIVESTNSGITTALNTSTSTSISFAGPQTLSSEAAPTAIAGGAFTGDGFADLAAFRSTGVTVYNSRGDGTFGTAYTGLSVIGTNVFASAVADLNSDGNADIVLVTSAVVNTATVYPIRGYITTGSSTATLATSFPQSGTEALTATWPGNFEFSASSAQLSLQVNGIPTSTSLATSGTPSQYGQSVTFSSLITYVSNGVTPTGSIAFYDGTALLAVITLSNGSATFTTSALTAGTHSITAVYLGNSVFAGSGSGVLVQVVTQAQPVITWLSPVPITYGTALTAAQLNATTTVPGTFVYTPAAGTVLSAGANQMLRVVFTPTDLIDYSVATASTTITVNKATPTVSWTAPAPIVVGTPLSATQLDATATGISGTLAGSFVYTPASGTLLAAGSQTLSVQFIPTDLGDYNTANATTTISVLTPTITAVSPASANLGDPSKTVTVTGIGFVSNTVLQVNGTAIATTFVSGTSLTAIIPASYFQTIQTVPLTVYDPTQSQTSAPFSFAVVAVPVQATFTGPSTTQPAQQPTLSFTLTNPYPVVLTATLTLTFTGTGGVNDPNIQFANGSRTYTFTVAANSTTIPTIQIQSGTVAGTITITLVLMGGGQNVTPASVLPLVITVPPVAPAITSATLTRSGNAVTVNIIGYSNTRELQQAVFHFVPSSGSTIDDPNITVPVATLFATWYATAGSQAYGSSFLYNQTFNLSESDATIGSITVTLINTSGASTVVTVQ